MIRAEAHPDDHALTVNFDAAKWFINATHGEIIALASTDSSAYTPKGWEPDCETWGYDYESDVVAQYMADHVSDLRDLFKYIEIRQNLATCGFECYVHAGDAREWLRRNRPDVYASLPDPDGETETFVISPPGSAKERIISAANAIQEAMPGEGDLPYKDIRKVNGYAENILIYAGKIVEEPIDEPWDDNLIQFALLLSAIHTIREFDDDEYRAILQDMELDDMTKIDELFCRAEVERTRVDNSGRVMRVTPYADAQALSADPGEIV